MVDSLRRIYHALPREEARRLGLLPAALERGGPPYAPASLAREGFIHCSFEGSIAESVRLYFRDTPVVVLAIDVDALGLPPLEVADTPRGPMPHVRGAIPRSAIVQAWDDAEAIARG